MSRTAMACYRDYELAALTNTSIDVIYGQYKGLRGSHQSVVSGLIQ